jgi:hypothetical protein
MLRASVLRHRIEIGVRAGGKDNLRATVEC